MLLTAIIGGNSPDLDLLVSYRGRLGGQLAYLLQHRGYTHTVVGCVILAAVLYAGVETWMRWRHFEPSRTDRAILAGVALFGTGLHLAMDALNSYGVHPFWPLRNEWIYGDSVYIVEPLYWAAAAPLLFVVRSLAARVFLGLALLVAVLVSALSGLVAPVAVGFLTGFAAVLALIGRRATARTASLAAALAFVLVTVGFIAAGHAAAREGERLAHADFPADGLIDDVLTPMPANPLCWDALVLQVHGDRYFARHAVIALAPRLIPAVQCGGSPVMGRPTWVPQTPAAIEEAASLRWREFSMSRDSLIALIDGHCQARALMQFARAPFAVYVGPGAGTGWIVGDLRFVRGATPGFSDIHLAAEPRRQSPCTPPVPWGVPREDLLHR